MNFLSFWWLECSNLENGRFWCNCNFVITTSIIFHNVIFCQAFESYLDNPLAWLFSLMSPPEVYHSPPPGSEFCSRWSCLFSNISAAWIAPVNINAPQLHYLYLPRGIANLFCKWERKDMWYVQAGRSIGLSISLTQHTPQQKFSSFPRNSISGFIAPNGSSPQLFLSPSFNVYNDSENIWGIWNG